MWRAQFLSHTFQILEINLSLEAVKIIILYLMKFFFIFWCKKMEKSSLSIYRDLYVAIYNLLYGKMKKLLFKNDVDIIINKIFISKESI